MTGIWFNKLSTVAWFASLHLSSPIEFLELPSRQEMNVCPDDYDGWFSGGCI
ncbi:hypothetical protein [Acinetobacter ursingii]|uniref:hypothetical protein n=1 Tax=Acinetobacter ursingii TaxID=108980 RepID=UPI003009E3AC